jgi:DNA-binding CsgD family transcriptional regulator
MAKRVRPRHPDILTPREWEVLALLREGLSNREIGERLEITERGARHHVSEILSKLGVASREEAAAWEPGSGADEEGRPWWARVIRSPLSDEFPLTVHAPIAISLAVYRACSSGRGERDYRRRTGR